MMTGEEDERLMRQAFALGAFEYVVKPYDFNALKSLLSRVKQLTESA